MRLNFESILPDGLEGMLALERAIHESSLEPELLELLDEMDNVAREACRMGV